MLDKIKVIWAVIVSWFIREVDAVKVEAGEDEHQLSAWWVHIHDDLFLFAKQEETRVHTFLSVPLGYLAIASHFILSIPHWFAEVCHEIAKRLQYEEGVFLKLWGSVVGVYEVTVDWILAHLPNHGTDHLVGTGQDVTPDVGTSRVGSSEVGS